MKAHNRKTGTVTGVNKPLTANSQKCFVLVVKKKTVQGKERKLFDLMNIIHSETLKVCKWASSCDWSLWKVTEGSDGRSFLDYRIKAPKMQILVLESTDIQRKTQQIQLLIMVYMSSCYRKKSQDLKINSTGKLYN